MKFYATQPSRARLEEDVLAFVSLVKYQRDEQAEKMVHSTGGQPAAVSLHKALSAQGLLKDLDDPSIDGPWRDKVEDPLDRYAPDAVRQVVFSGGKGPQSATYRVHLAGAPTSVMGRFAVENKGAGFTLGFSGFEVFTAPKPKPEFDEIPRAEPAQARKKPAPRR